MVVESLSRAIWLMVVISAIPLLASLLVGLVVSVLQAATQIQEMTLTFVPKLITFTVIATLFGGWMSEVLHNFCIEIFLYIASV